MRWLPLAIAALAMCAVCSLWMSAQQPGKQKKAPQETYTRPKPTRPIHPEIPSANRNRTDKVFLEKADSLYRLANDVQEHQIVKGDVAFRQGGMWMYCDSAYYFPELNSLDAFGHVKMQQGDTLFVYADKLFYNGNERRARLRCGPSEPTVRLINRNVTLTTDSLDYDLNMELGWYAYGGRIDDKVNVLTSVYGQYSPATKEAEFYHNVELDNNRDHYKMFTDTLLYNTYTHIARIVSPTKIVGDNDTILTSSGTYNTTSDNAVLNSRSTIIHRDSAGNVTTLLGDSIIYDKATRISRAYMFGSGRKLPQPVVLTDTANKMTLIGGYAMYNDSTQEALASVYPLLIEYSRPDTLFLRADTILTYIETRMVFPPLPADSLAALAGDSLAALAGDSVTPPALPPLAPGDSLAAAAHSAAPPGLEPRPESLSEPDSEPDEGKPDEGKPRPQEADSQPDVADMLRQDSDSVPPPPQPLQQSETDTPPAPAARDSSEMVPKQFHVAKAFHRARFFNQDLQGVADSMIFVEYDSMLYLHVKPVVWSGERQVMGGKIHVHFNDSTPDWALLPDYGMMIEHVEEDFYNQLSGDVMKAWFENKDLRHMDVDGSVQTIFLPQDNDSTYSRLVNANSSHLSMDLTDRKLDRLKMWPDVDGTVSPLFMVKNNQKLLPGFRWLIAIRPKREWYGDRYRWADDLGEVSDELEAYFAEKSEPTGSRRYVRRDMPGSQSAPAPGSPAPATAPANADNEPAEETVTVFSEEGEVIMQEPEQPTQSTETESTETESTQTQPATQPAETPDNAAPDNASAETPDSMEGGER